MFTRFKRDTSGLRAVVELWESLPKKKRETLIQAGKAEDPNFTEKILSCLMTFQDILDLSDSELCELLATTPERLVAVAISGFPEDMQARFLKCAKGARAAEIRDNINPQNTLAQIGGAQLKMIEFARALERDGLIKVKQIPG